MIKKVVLAAVVALAVAAASGQAIAGYWTPYGYVCTWQFNPWGYYGCY